MLEVENLEVFYGPVQALFGVSLRVEAGEIVTLVGRNGAGKSTLLRAISGLVPACGSVRFAGEELLGRAPEQIVRRGVAHVPEGRRIFPGLTVVENLQVAAYAVGAPEARVREDVGRVLDLFPGLRARSRSYGWSLSGGEQQMLAIGRGLMARPRLLLLDEPSLGLAPLLVDELFRTIGEIRSAGTAVLLAEQNAAMALALADRAYVLENGRITREGPGSELLQDEGVIAAYLGGGA
ncbi:ABC transporter ATP-binding protein [Caldinitratiruptor microaerophilus]|uniref:ABC transporter ATP-binding protein n=1 Tax=Caldinitratiruptor microaerophilus TaxID=671077 RepID=A0AA35G8G6_9FIRM|nr:ABC transporter ATP-binding protein [Caldinitratiruptor microaerophilus]BDG61041.1 ABC transporter ATP-binding protein [Caldinitratiruptor microaerophilus]